MPNWIKCYAHPKLWLIALMGISCGMPLALITKTMTVWLSEYGISKTTIGLFVFVGMPYTLKFLWAPFIDHFKIPILTKKLGQRRSWLLVFQILLLVTILVLSTLDPKQNLQAIAVLCVIIAFFSATQDLIVDGYRIQILRADLLAAGGTMEVFGYRMGMLLSGAGVLYIASIASWSISYRLIAFVMLLGIATTLFLAPRQEIISERVHGFKGAMNSMIIAPFRDFMNHNNWAVALIFIICFKVSDAMIAQMSSPFYLELGFSKVDIATASKLYGFWAILLGGFIGGALVQNIGIRKSLFLFGAAHALSNCMFLVQYLFGADHFLFYTSVSMENLTLGMMLSALIAYLSGLCNPKFATTQYALMMSIVAFSKNFLASSSGFLVDFLGWSSFFCVTLCLALPGLALIRYIPLGRFEEQEEMSSSHSYSI